jgi:DNA-binding transcriptional ArsR family regulator
MAQPLEHQTLFDALGNPVRREIMRLLRSGPRPVGELAQELPVSRPAVSKHLKLLEEVGLVAHDANGTRNLYRLDRRGFDDARAWLDTFWDEALARFALVAENTAPSKQKSVKNRARRGRR